ncbi:MAG TPA: bifunctional homocysteine S-methyltransferase/methylenetetrahydrofolate reductase [Vicinamibacterales bacterium]|nr:bifunctional homocysteine S-methyltransferase/methylenetetrahydrofolate reductase [Vicinamibacterales bacterium]
MIQPFLEAIDERVLVCDGAMGTMLYAQGVFINRSFDSLNLSDPTRVLAVHRAYAQSGADVIETNTFGANRIKLRAFGLAERLREINQAGARLARDGAGGSAYVAGAIGPLGIRIEPWGRMGRDEAHEYFREQVQALLDGGVDLFILETFRDLNEIRAAIGAVRSVCTLPIVAQMTIEDDGNTLDGTAPEQFAPSLQEAGANVIGLNCSIGPAHMLETLERMTAATGASLSAQPNAGRPRDVEGRTIYLTSPEYMASYARRFAERRVRLVGGCCGTTPTHIAEIKSALSRVGTAPARPASHARGMDDERRPASMAVDEPLNPSEKSVLSRAFANRRWVRLIEVVPPRGHETKSVIEDSLQLRARGVDAVHVPDGASGPRLSALSLAALIRERAGIEVVLQFSARDKPLVGIQSELLGAYAMGIRNLLAVTGEVHPIGDYPDATTLVDVDSIGLVNAVARLNHGLDVGGQTIGSATRFHIGVTVNAGAEDLDEEIRRFDWKVDAGAEYVVTRPVFDVTAFDRIHPRLETSRLPVVLSVRPFESVLDAEYLANEVPGTHVPGTMIERMRRASSPDAAAKEGVAIAVDVARTLRGRVQGVNVVPPPGRFDLGLALLDALT